MADSLSNILLVAGAGLAGYAVYEMVKKPPGDEEPVISNWTAGDVLARSHDGVDMGIITIARVTGPGTYLCWSGWYGHGPLDLQPIMDWTLVPTSDAELDQYEVVKMTHVVLPAGS
jgi:hypothetical protein